MALSEFPSDDINALDSLASTGQLSIASPEAAMRRPLGELVEGTILASAKGNDNTAKAYVTAIGQFLEFLDMRRGSMLPPDLAEKWRPFAERTKDGKKVVWVFRPPAAILRLVDANLLDGFAVWRASVGDSTNSVATRTYAIRTFLSVAYRDNVLTYEQATAMRIQPYRARQKHDHQPVGRRLSPEEVRELRESVDIRTRKGRRDLTLLDAMLYLGLRREEVINLRVGNFRQDGGRLWVILTGKGGKTRRLKVHDALLENLSSWMACAGIGWDETDSLLFRSVNKGDRVSLRAINASVVGRLVAEYGHKAGLAPRHGKSQLSAHDLRRTCARNAFQNSGNLLLVQAMLGHSDPKTTARYIGAFDDDDQTAVDFVRY
jgi:integrase